MLEGPTVVTCAKIIILIEFLRPRMYEFKNFRFRSYSFIPL